MSLPQTSLAAIQVAGQAAFDAAQTVSESLRLQAQSIVTQVASQPLHADSERAFAQFKALAALSHELQAVEVQLRGIYTKACELASPVMDVLGNPPRLVSHALASASAEDAQVKSIRSIKPIKSTKSSKRGRPGKLTKAAKFAKTATGRNASIEISLTPNDNKLLSFLHTALKTDNWTTLTGVKMADGAGLPLGSVGVSLNKLLAKGSILRGDRGLYRLPQA